MEHLKNIVDSLPENPGCYQYLDKEGVIIYVGKAKNLRKRVASYFIGTQESLKTRLLIEKIRDIRYVVVHSEEDALLLENNLIKQHQPKYNVMLKDGKTYPSICITNEEYPRIFKTRKIDKRWGTFFGPYSHYPTVVGLVELLNKMFRFRSCRLPLTQGNIQSGRYKVCLDYHIKKCDGVCIGKVSREAYFEKTEKAKAILRGQVAEISKGYYQEMQRLSGELRFEEAEEAKQVYELLERYRERSEVVNRSVHDVDVFSIVSDEKVAYINYLHIAGGAINQAFTFEYKKKLAEDEPYLLGLGIVEMRARFRSQSKEIVVSQLPDISIEGCEYTMPTRGDRKKLLDLSLLNVRQYRLDSLKQAEKLNPEQRTTRLLTEIKEQLHLEKLPYRIECFDNSHIQGSNPVCGCVVFTQGKATKSEYRKYQIKEAKGGDDYDSMREVARRRYCQIVAGTLPAPDLIIVDGGKGQMEAMRGVIEDELGLRIPLVGLAKNHKHRTSEVLCGNPPMVLGIKQGTPLFRLLESIQTEVHRFALSYHQARRSKSQIHSLLDDIKGIGVQTKGLLLKEYKSVKRIREADEQAIAQLIGKHKATILKQALHASEASTADTALMPSDEKNKTR